MKILMLLESEFPPDVRVENEIAALTEAAHEVHLACTTRKNRLAEERFGSAVIHRKPISNFIYKSSVGALKLPFYFNFWRKFISDLLRNEKFDVIHVHDLPLSRIGAEVKNMLKIPMVLDLHENWPALLKHAKHTRTLAGRLLSSDRQWTEYEKNMVRNADMVITIIEEARERIISLGVEPSKTCIVSNTVKTEDISLSGKKRDNDDFIIFYGGGINRHRGLQVVLDALKKMESRRYNLKLQIAGSGSYLKDLRLQAKNLGVEKYVEFMGHRPYHEMMSLLNEADAAIIPHLRTENNDASSPNKLYQYMYLGKPVISSDCTSLKRILTENDAGYIYKDDSPEELAGLIGNLYSERQQLRIKGENGRRAVLSGLNWNTDKKRLVELYQILQK